MDDDKLDAFRLLVEQCSNIVFFTGAGISTDSGIPDFRSPGTGLWNKVKPIEFSDFMASDDVRQESWRRSFSGERTIEFAEPNRGHRAVARLVEMGKTPVVITQNVDNLHQRSGIPHDQVIELHGNTTYASCLDCGDRYDLEPIRRAFMVDETLPVCERCGGIVKTATISFGQAMPAEEMDRASRETAACDLFMAIGSSLVVYPAAGFPAMAKRDEAALVIINRQPTDLDPLADLVINAEIGPTLSAVAGDVG